MTGLTALENFLFYDNPKLCAPADDAFQAWFDGNYSIGSICAAADSQDDRAVLAALHKAMDGDNWTDDTNWLSDRPIWEWRGVTSDADGRVTALILLGNQLSGAIPTELGNLANLQLLNLTSNQLSGTIPTELGNLPNLQRLYLNGNQLTGGIPTEIGSLSNLQYLNLARNQLSGAIPTELGSLSNLRLLSLDRNQLTGSIPTEIGNLSNLEQLYLSDNQLAGSIPTEIGNLSNLERLYLRRQPADRGHTGPNSAISPTCDGCTSMATS